MSDPKSNSGPRMLRVGAIYLVAFGGTYAVLSQFSQGEEETAAANVSLVLSNVLPMGILMSAILFAIGLFLTMKGRSAGLAAPEASDV